MNMIEVSNGVRLNNNIVVVSLNDYASNEVHNYTMYEVYCSLISYYESYNIKSRKIMRDLNNMQSQFSNMKEVGDLTGCLDHWYEKEIRYFNDKGEEI